MKLKKKQEKVVIVQCLHYQIPATLFQILIKIQFQGISNIAAYTTDSSATAPSER